MKHCAANLSLRQRVAATLMLAASLALLTPVVGWTRAQPQPVAGGAPQPRYESTRAGMSLDDAIQMVQQRYRARVLKADTRNENGRTVYHLRVVNDDGKVWTVRVDAQSGAVR